MSPRSGICRALNAEGVFVRRLPMAYAYHSPHMNGLQAELLAALTGIAPRNAKLAFFSTVSGRDKEGTSLDAEYWWRNLREPVLFADAVSAAVRAGHRLVVELGPQPALLRMAGECAAALGETIVMLPTLQRDVSSRRALMETLGQAWCHGVEPNWSAVYPGPSPHEPLPQHPWQRQRIGSKRRRCMPIARSRWTIRCWAGEFTARRDLGGHIDLARLPDLADHRIRGEA